MDFNRHSQNRDSNPEDERLKEIVRSTVRTQIALEKRNLSSTVETINATLQEVKSARQTLTAISKAHNEDLKRAADLIRQLTAAADRQEQTIAQLDGKIAALSSTIEQAQTAQAQAAQEKAEAQAEREKAQQAKEEADKAVARAKKIEALQRKQEELEKNHQANIERLVQEHDERTQAIDNQLAELA